MKSDLMSKHKRCATCLLFSAITLVYGESLSPEIPKFVLSEELKKITSFFEPRVVDDHAGIIGHDNCRYAHKAIQIFPDGHIHGKNIRFVNPKCGPFISIIVSVEEGRIKDNGDIYVPFSSTAKLCGREMIDTYDSGYIRYSNTGRPKSLLWKIRSGKKYYTEIEESVYVPFHDRTVIKTKREEAFDYIESARKEYPQASISAFFTNDKVPTIYIIASKIRNRKHAAEIRKYIPTADGKTQLIKAVFEGEKQKSKEKINPVKNGVKDVVTLPFRTIHSMALFVDKEFLGRRKSLDTTNKDEKKQNLKDKPLYNFSELHEIYIDCTDRGEKGVHPIPRRTSVYEWYEYSQQARLTFGNTKEYGIASLNGEEIWMLSPAAVISSEQDVLIPTGINDSEGRISE
jgi:hypothetical protein